MIKKGRTRLAPIRKNNKVFESAIPPRYNVNHVRHIIFKSLISHTKYGLVLSRMDIYRSKSEWTIYAALTVYGETVKKSSGFSRISWAERSEGFDSGDEADCVASEAAHKAFQNGGFYFKRKVYGKGLSSVAMAMTDLAELGGVSETEVTVVSYDERRTS